MRFYRNSQHLGVFCLRLRPSCGGKLLRAAAIIAAMGMILAPVASRAQYTADGGTDNAAHGLAIGQGASVTGANGSANGIAIGDNAIVNATSTGNDNGIAIGSNTQANVTGTTAGGSPTAIGSAANASGAGSQVAIGDQALASGTNAVAIGGHPFSTGTTATGDYSVAIGASSNATGTGALAFGGDAVSGATASGQDALAIGAGNVASQTNSIAIGYGNVVTGANSGALGDPNYISGTGSYAVGNNNGTVANPVATNNTFILGSNVTTTIGNDVILGTASASYASGTFTAGTAANAATTVGSLTYNYAGSGAPGNIVSVGNSTSPGRIENVAAGLLSATSTDAVNGSQLYAVASAASKIGSSVAAALGGGATMGADGTISAPAYTVGGTTYNNVGGAVTALQTSSPLQYSTSAAPTTPQGYLASQDVTLAGASAGPVRLHNVAAGTAPTDAANVSQLPGAFTSPSSNTFAFAQSGNGGAPVTLQNVAAGAVTANSTQAVNGAQLYSVSQASANGVNNLAQMLNASTQNLQNQINGVDQRAAGGTALALAASGLRYDDRPGKITIAAATGIYRDQAGFAGGAGYTSRDGHWRLNAAASFNPASAHSDVGAVAGASFSFP